MNPGQHDEHEDGHHAWSVLPKLVALGDKERTRKLRRSLWAWLAVVVVVVTVIGVVVNWTLVDRNPEDPVENWLDSMVDGRSRQGLATFSTGFGYSGADALPNRAYRAAQGRIERWEVTDVAVNGNTAEISAKVWWAEGQVPEGSTQGEEHTWKVAKEHRTGPFNDAWVMQDHEAATLSVRAPGVAEIAINGETERLNPRDRAAADGTGGVWDWEAMPGRFTVDLPEDSDYVLSDPVQPVTVDLNDPGPHEVSVAVEPSPNLWEEVDGQIRAEIEECMGSNSVAPEGCPSSKRWAEGNVPDAQAPESPMATPSGGGKPTPLEAPKRGADIKDVEWELVSRPALWLVPDEDSDSPLDWKASEHRAAEAKLTYYEDGRRVEELIDFPVHVDVTSDGKAAETTVSLD